MLMSGVADADKLGRRHEVPTEFNMSFHPEDKNLEFMSCSRA